LRILIRIPELGGTPMPKRVEQKPETAFRNAKPKSRPYLLADGSGLSLRVRPAGTKTWLLRYRRPGTGKENFLSLGPYPDITLLDARRLAATARNLVRDGIDPVEHRQAESAARKRAAQNAFQLVANAWLEFKRKGWADETYRKAELVIREPHSPTALVGSGIEMARWNLLAQRGYQSTITAVYRPCFEASVRNV